MAYDEGVAQRVREALEAHRNVVEKRMFGGLAFMLRGHMCCGVVGRKIMVRVGPKGYKEALAQPHARVMNFTGRALKGFVYVAPAGIESDVDLEKWVTRAVQFNKTLPAK